MSKSKEPKEKKSGLSLKTFLIGIPLFIIQLVAIYFIEINLVIKYEHDELVKTKNELKVKTAAAEKWEKIAREGGIKKDTKKPVSEQGKYMVNIEDMVINPAYCMASRFLQVSVSLDVATPEQQKLIEEQNVIAKDVINDVLISKTAEQLSTPSFRDTLKVEIIQKMQKKYEGAPPINNVFFSKFLLQ